MAERMRVGKVATTSYNGIAAVNIDGVTLCSLLDIGQYEAPKNTFAEAIGSLSDTRLDSIRNELDWENLALFVVDEISTVDANIIAMIDARLQKVMGNKEPFGGIAMLFTGDFNQLGAVQKMFLLNDMIGYAAWKEAMSKKIAPPQKKKKKSRKRKADSATFVHMTSAAKIGAKITKATVRRERESKRESGHLPVRPLCSQKPGPPWLQCLCTI